MTPEPQVGDSLSPHGPYQAAINAALDAKRECWCEYVDIGVGDQKVAEHPECPRCTPDGEAAWYLERMLPHIKQNAVRGDAVAAWLKTKRDEYQKHATSWYALDSLLDDYRRHADCGTPLSEETPESSGTAYGVSEPASGTPDTLTGHVAVTCNCHRTGCNFCDGGLWACDVCGGLEGSMPSKCPRDPMTAEQRDAVYRGRLDYRDNGWVEGVASRYCPTGLFGKAGLLGKAAK